MSDQFGGKPIRVVSGFRRNSHSRESRHKQGRAVDFSIECVPNTALSEYCRTLGAVGVGYYPNSSFVHLDVRKSAAAWIDDSGPGQAPRYRRKGARTDVAEDEDDHDDHDEGEDDHDAPDADTSEKKSPPDAEHADDENTDRGRPDGDGEKDAPKSEPSRTTRPKTSENTKEGKSSPSPSAGGAPQK